MKLQDLNGDSENVEGVMNEQKHKPGDAFLDAVNCMHDKDHAALVLIDHEGNGSLIVERNNIKPCLKALLCRFLDERNSRLNYEPEEARKQIERVIKGWLDEWSAEQ